MLKKSCLSLLALLFAASAVFSQSKSPSPYALDWRADAATLAGGLGLSVTGHIIQQSVGYRTPDEVEALSFNRLMLLDKSSTLTNSHIADDASDWFARGSFLLPLALMADEDMRSDAAKIGILFSETMFLANGLTSVAKGSFKRDRPYVFNPDVLTADKLSPGSRFSFFSGHTSMTASLTFFSAKVWSDYHPDSKLKPLVWTAAAAIPAVTGYLRCKAGKHYFSDVATGYAVGALIGYFVPHLHKVDRRSKRKLRFSSTMMDQTPLFVVKYRM